MKEVKPEVALMRKTKKELVDIILRKDDVELRLKNDLKSKDEVINVLTDKNVGYEAEIQHMKVEHNEDIHYIMESKKVLHKKTKCIRVWQALFVITLVAAIIIIGCIA